MSAISSYIYAKTDGGISVLAFFFSSRRRHTRWNCDWSSDVCYSDLTTNDERLTTDRSKLLQVLRWTRSERAARGEAEDEVDRSGRRHASAHPQCDPRAAPKSGYSGFQAEDGDCPHIERRRLHCQLQAVGRRGPQGPAGLLEIRQQQRSRDLEPGARVASGLPGVCAAHRDSTSAGRARDQHPNHAEGRDDGTPGAQTGPGRRVVVRDLVETRLAASPMRAETKRASSLLQRVG